MSNRFRLTPLQVRMSENDIEKSCVDLLHLYRYFPVRQHVGRFRTPDDRWVTIGKPGDPDWIAVKSPSFFLEVKRPGEVATDLQLRRHAELRLYGFDILVVESAEQLRDWLEEWERAP